MKNSNATPLDLFERKTILVHSEDGLHAVPVWVYGELFIDTTMKLDGEPACRIGCAPLGVMFPAKRLGFFFNIEAATNAVLELSKLRNSWATIEEFTPELCALLEEINDRFEGKQLPFGTGHANKQHVIVNGNPKDYQ